MLLGELRAYKTAFFFSTLMKRKRLTFIAGTVYQLFSQSVVVPNRYNEIERAKRE